MVKDDTHGVAWAELLGVDYDTFCRPEFKVDEIEDDTVVDWQRFVKDNAAEIKEAKDSKLAWDKGVKVCKAAITVAISEFTKGKDAIKAIVQDDPQALWQMLDALRTKACVLVVARRDDKLVNAVMGRIGPRMSMEDFVVSTRAKVFELKKPVEQGGYGSGGITIDQLVLSSIHQQLPYKAYASLRERLREMKDPTLEEVLEKCLELRSGMGPQIIPDREVLKLTPGWLRGFRPLWLEAPTYPRKILEIQPSLQIVTSTI